MSERILVVDTETTGFSPCSDRVVEFAAIEVRPRTGALGNRFRRLVNPGRDIPERVVRLHGITNEKVYREPSFPALADELTDFLRGAIVAIHNSTFDVGMLNAELVRARKPRLEDLGVRVVDTVAVARSIYPLLPSHSLDALCRHLHIGLADRVQHGALLDAQLLAQALPKMASDYDAWMGAPDEAHSPELDRFECTLQEYCNALLRSLDRSTAEKSDEGLSRLATVLRWADARHGELLRRCEALIGDASWCNKNVLARRTARVWMNWKAAAEDLLHDTDLSAYATAAASHVVTPQTAVPDASFLATLDPVLACMKSSAHCVARAIMVLFNVRETLAIQRKAQRVALLRYAEAGYTPRRASVKVLPRTSVAYEAAVAEHARGADLESYRCSTSRLTLRARSASACRVLFGVAA